LYFVFPMPIMSAHHMDTPASARRRFRPLDYLKISIFGAGLALFWASLHSLILPARIQELVPEASKNTFLGLMTFSGLLIAALVQPFAGAISDRSTLRWGQRRPFILLGTALALAFLPGIALSETYLLLLLTYCALQLCCNIAQAPFQAFIPDFVPASRHGVAAGVKSLTETISVVVLLRFLAYIVDRYRGGISKELDTAVIGLAIVLVIAMALTILLVKEGRPRPRPHPPLHISLANAFRVDLRGRRDFLWFLLSRLLILMSLGTLQTFAFYYLSDFIRVSAPAAATSHFLVAVGGGMVAAIYPAAWASDRLGRKPVLVVSGLLGISAIGLLLFASDYAAVITSSALLGVSAGTFISTNWALATDLVPPGEEAAYLGLTNVATAGAGALARLIGPAIDYLNAQSPGRGYTAMLVTCIVYFAAGTILMLKIKEEASRTP
ncbi:MAG: MFS transporter, partial [Chloroflexota bacterium]